MRSNLRAGLKDRSSRPTVPSRARLDIRRRKDGKWRRCCCCRAAKKSNRDCEGRVVSFATIYIISSSPRRQEKPQHPAREILGIHRGSVACTGPVLRHYRRFDQAGIFLCFDAQRHGKRFIITAENLSTPFLSLEREAITLKANDKSNQNQALHKAYLPSSGQAGRSFRVKLTSA